MARYLLSIIFALLVITGCNDGIIEGTDGGMITLQEARDAGMHSVDDRRSNYGNTVTVKSQSVEQFNGATRLVELIQQSVQPLTVTWTGQLLTTISPSGGTYEQAPLVRIAASTGSVRQEYWFDAVPGGQFSVPCTELSVD